MPGDSKSGNMPVVELIFPTFSTIKYDALLIIPYTTSNIPKAVDIRPIAIFIIPPFSKIEFKYYLNLLILYFAPIFGAWKKFSGFYRLIRA